MVTIRIEPVAYMLLNGLIELAFEAHEELEYEHNDMPYAPDWEAYQRSEDANAMRFFAMREGDKLIGYASVIIDNELHRKGLVIASFRDIFITKSKRGYAPRMVRYIETVLSELGVKRILAGERLTSGNASGRFYKAMGYEPQETIHGKTLH